MLKIRFITLLAYDLFLSGTFSLIEDIIMCNFILQLANHGSTAAKKLGDLDVIMPMTDTLYLRAKIDVEAPLIIELGAGTMMEKTEQRET